jgi:hypothetical protein
MTDVDQDQSNASRIQWTPSIETMLARWGDEAKCFEWMHSEAYSFYDGQSRNMMIASNVLTAVSGLSNVIAGGSIVNGFQLSWVFGSLAIAVSITNMLQEKLGYTAKAAQHNQYSIQWGSIRRKIEEALSMPPEFRKDCNSFMKYVRQDINQVSISGNSMIPERIKKACFDKFNTVPDFDIPDICGKMEHTRMYIRGDTKKTFNHTSLNSDIDMRVPEHILARGDDHDTDNEKGSVVNIAQVKVADL